MSTPGRSRMRTRSFLLIGLLVALVLAGVVSYYASSHPDGLERVAQDHGFGDAAQESATAGSPVADYGTRGVDDPRLSGGIAGVVGVLVVLGVGSGLAYAVRRRSRLAPAGPGEVSGSVATEASAEGATAASSSDDAAKAS